MLMTALGHEAVVSEVGNDSPREGRATTSSASVDLPVPGLPSSNTRFPLGSHPGYHQSVATGSMFVAQTSSGPESRPLPLIGD